MDINTTFVTIRDSTVREIEKIDGPKQWLRNSWTTGIGGFDISVFRGTAIEKASIARVSLELKKAVEGPGEAPDIARLEGLQVNIYPANPLLPVALLNLERRQLASGIRLGGYLSIFPMKEDAGITGPVQKAFSSIVKSTGKSMDQAAREYGQLWRELAWQGKPEKGIGIKISGDDTNLDTMKNAFISVVNGFFSAVGQNKDLLFSAGDEKNMFSFRYKLAEFILVKDPSTQLCFKNGVELETLASMILPPVVKF